MQTKRLSAGGTDRFARQAKAQLRAAQRAIKLSVGVVKVWNEPNRKHQYAGSPPAGLNAAARKTIEQLRWIVFRSAILYFICWGTVVERCSAAEKPNIVVIMADDLGLGDVSYHVRTIQKGQPLVETPTLDSLAAKSLWFTDSHSATALCAPTRYAVMSGNNKYRSNAPWGVWSTFGESAFVKGHATLGTVVRNAGYQTGFVGK